MSADQQARDLAHLTPSGYLTLLRSVMDHCPAADWRPDLAPQARRFARELIDAHHDLGERFNMIADAIEAVEHGVCENSQTIQNVMIEELSRQVSDATFALLAPRDGPRFSSRADVVEYALNCATQLGEEVDSTLPEHWGCVIADTLQELTDASRHLGLGVGNTYAVLADVAAALQRRRVPQDVQAELHGALVYHVKMCNYALLRELAGGQDSS